MREIGDALHILRGPFGLSGANACLEASDVLAEGLQAAQRDKRLLGRLHEFNDWVQRSLIDLTAGIAAAFFRPSEPQQAQSQEATQTPDSDPGENPNPAQTKTQTQTQTQTKGQTQDQKQS